MAAASSAERWGLTMFEHGCLLFYHFISSFKSLESFKQCAKGGIMISPLHKKKGDKRSDPSQEPDSRQIIPLVGVNNVDLPPRWLGE